MTSNNLFFPEMNNHMNDDASVSSSSSNTSTMDALGMLIGAFAMIPVLSDYSCRLKADCREELATRKRGSFFSAPQES